MLPMIDVRDLANLHIVMAFHPSFNSHGRFLLSTQSMWFSEIIGLLKAKRTEIGLKKQIKTRVLGMPTMLLGALINP